LSYAPTVGIWLVGRTEIIASLASCGGAPPKIRDDWLNGRINA